MAESDQDLAASSRATRLGGSFAELLDRVVWDYSPSGTEPSPLVSTARFFDEFPWNGETSQAAKSHDEVSA